MAFKYFSGIAYKIRLVHTMLTLPAWQSLNLSVNFFSIKYTNHYAGYPNLLEHMRVQVGSMGELPCYTVGGDYNSHQGCESDCDSQNRDCDFSSDTAVETIEDRGVSGLNKEWSVQVEQLTTKQLQTTTAAEKISSFNQYSENPP